MRVLLVTTYTIFDRKTLCMVRSLAMSGVHVSVGGDQWLCESFYSRFCNQRIRFPHPSEDVEGFIQCLLQHVDENEYDVLLPMCDYTTLALSRYREKFNTYLHVPVPDYETLLKSRDKLQTLAIAKQIGIQTPTTYCIRDRLDLESIADLLNYPCVLKLRQGAGGIGIEFPDSYESLIDCYDRLPSASDMVFDYMSPIIQEYIPGEVRDVCLLFNQGEPRAILTQRRIKMYPSRGGVGILNETTDDPELKDKAVMLLKALKWHGPAQVEFKIDSRDGVPKLMEINGRYWGTLGLSLTAGINFPLLACKMAIEGDIGLVSEYKVGLRYRWVFPFGLLYLIERGGGWRSLWEFFSFERDKVLWLTDPLPTLAKVTYIFRSALIRCFQFLLSYIVPK